MEAGGRQGRRRVLAPGDAAPPEGFYESRTHRPSNHTKLRETERVYKNKRLNIGDWPALLDLSAVLDSPLVNVLSVPAPPGSCFGWAPDACVRVCSFKSAPGLYVLPSALSTAHQAQLATHAYTTLSHPTYDCSLQNTVRLPATGTLLQHWLHSLRPANGGECHGGCAARGASDGHPVPDGRASPRLELMPRDAPGIERVMRRLRWIVLGYRYDWSSLSYDWKEQPQPLPPCIASLAHDTVELLRQMPVGLQCGVYKPQAAVVNFYQIFDSLTSHVDRSEPAAGAPLVSLSLGCPAVFVFGGESREDDALALLLRSGDVLVMADSARKCFHGVPRVLELPHALSPPPTLPLRPTLPKSSQPCRDADSDPTTELSEWHLIQQLLQSSRININIRQVEP